MTPTSERNPRNPPRHRRAQLRMAYVSYRMMTRLLAVALVPAAAACTQHMPGPPAPPPTTAPTNTYTAAPASQTTKPPLQPGPHSAIADIDLPAGTVPGSIPNVTGEDEYWRYTAPYAETVTFLQTQFATGRRYDAYG